MMPFTLRQISVCVLGQTLTTQEGDSGSYSLGQVHDRVRRDIETSDGRQLAATLRRDLVVPIVQLNRGVRDEYPRVVIEREETMDMQALSDALPKLVPLGLPVGVDEVLSRLGLKRPEQADDVLAAPAAPGGMDDDPDDPGAGGDRAAMARALVALARRADPEVRDAIDVAVARASDNWEPLMEPAVAPILAAARDHLSAGGSLRAFRARLPALFDAMDDQAVVRLLHRLGFTGGLSGREIPDDG